MKDNSNKSVFKKKEITTASGLSVKVVYKNAKEKRLVAGGAITEEDAKMDEKAKEAISVAIKKKKILAKPVAVYDKINHKTYLEYNDGKREEIKQ